MCDRLGAPWKRHLPGCKPAQLGTLHRSRPGTVHVHCGGSSTGHSPRRRRSETRRRRCEEHSPAGNAAYNTHLASAGTAAPNAIADLKVANFRRFGEAARAPVCVRIGAGHAKLGEAVGAAGGDELQLSTVGGERSPVGRTLARVVRTVAPLAPGARSSTMLTHSPGTQRQILV